MSTRPESLSLCLPHASSPIPNSEVSCSHFSLSGFLPCPFARNVHLSPLCGAYPFPSLGWRLLWALQKVGRAWGGDASGRDRGRGSVLGPVEDLSWWVGTVIASGHTETDRMDFLRLHLPGLHQALRGALVRGAKRCQTLSPCSLGPHLPSFP